MQEYIIRPYEPGDDEAVSEVVRQVFEEYGFPWQPERYNADTADIQTHYLSKGGAFWVAAFNGLVVGAGGFLPKCDQRCELHRLYFLKEHRGKGIGGKMLRTIAEEARRKGFTHMEFWSDKLLTTAHKVYERYGAKLIAERRVEDPDYASYDEWGYLLDLDAFLNQPG